MNRYRVIYPYMILTAGLVLRLWDLTSCPAWYDESFTRLLAGLPLDRLILATAGDVHPPFYYLMVWAAAHLAGNSLLVLRLVSVVFSMLGLLAFHRLTGLLHLDTPARLVALGLLTFHPVSVFYAQEARMYTLLLFLVIMQAVRLVERNWVSLAFFTLLALYTHNYAIFYTTLLGLVGLLVELKRPIPAYRAGIDGTFSHMGIPGLVAALGLPGLAFLPWVLVLVSQMRTIAGGYWIQPITAGSTLLAVLQILAGWNIPDWIIPWTALNLFVGLLALALAGIRARRWALVLLAFGPLALAVAGSLAWKPILLFRGLIGIVPALAILAGETWTSSSTRGRVLGAALVLPILVTLVWQIGVNHAGAAKGTALWPEFRGITIHLDDESLVIAGDPSTNFLLDAGCPEEGGALSRTTRAALGFRSIRLADLPEHYQFAGMVTPLSTACHLSTFTRITKTAQPVYLNVRPLATWGIWNAKR